MKKSVVMILITVISLLLFSCVDNSDYIVVPRATAAASSFPTDIQTSSFIPDTPGDTINGESNIISDSGSDREEDPAITDITITPTEDDTSEKVTTKTESQKTEPQKTEPQKTETTKQEQSKNIVLVSVTSPIGRNETATITVKGKPGVEYSIKVYYSTAASTAKGLENKTADNGGNVSWSWKVGGRTNPGNHKIVIIGGGETATFYFETVE